MGTVMGWCVWFPLGVMLVGLLRRFNDYGCTRTPGLMLLPLSPKPSNHSAAFREEETARTILSVVDPATNEYLNVWNHPQYLSWKKLLLSDAPSPSLHGVAVLHLDKTRLDRVGDSLTVSWNTTIVQDDNVLALYCGTTWVDAATIAQARATSQRHWKELVEMHNQEDTPPSDAHSWFIPRFPSSIREPTCRFVLYSIDKNNATVLAASPTLSIEPNTKTPTQIHLALTSNPSQVVIQFTTGDEGTPVAMYGKQKKKKHYYGNDDYKVEGTSTTYTPKDLCGAPANITSLPGHFVSPGQLHTVMLSNLQPNTVYHYQVGIALGQGIVWNEDVYSFVSPPAVTTSTTKQEQDNYQVEEPYSFVVYGDQGTPSLGWGMGSTWIALAIAKEVSRGHHAYTARSRNAALQQRHGPHHHDDDKKKNTTAAPLLRAVHHIGGLSYARGAAHIWDEWMSLVQLFAARIPLMIAVGSAEYDYAIALEGPAKVVDPSGSNHSYQPSWGNYGNESGGECGVPVSRRFQMPSSANSNGVFWHSYDSGPWLHTIVLSTEHDLTPSSPQYKWLVQDLASTRNRTLAPFVIVEMHRPMYMNQALWDDNGVSLALRRSLEPLFHETRINLVLSAHYHSYFRSCEGLFQSQCNNGGPTYLTIGTAGAKPHLQDYYEATWAAKTLQNHFGYGRITIYNASALEFQWILVGNGENETEAGLVMDHFWMFK